MAPGSTTNELLAWGFRALVALCTFIGIPTVGWLASRAVSSLDNVATLSEQHTVQLQKIVDHVDDLSRITGDHETRIRALEHNGR